MSIHKSYDHALKILARTSLLSIPDSAKRICSIHWDSAKCRTRATARREVEAARREAEARVEAARREGESRSCQT